MSTISPGRRRRLEIQGFISLVVSFSMFFPANYLTLKLNNKKCKL